MTVGELIEKLQTYDKNLHVQVRYVTNEKFDGRYRFTSYGESSVMNAVEEMDSDKHCVVMLYTAN